MKALGIDVYYPSLSFKTIKKIEVSKLFGVIQQLILLPPSVQSRISLRSLRVTNFGFFSSGSSPCLLYTSHTCAHTVCVWMGGRMRVWRIYNSVSILVMQSNQIVFHPVCCRNTWFSKTGWIVVTHKSFYCFLCNTNPVNEIYIFRLEGVKNNSTGLKKGTSE